MAAHASPEPRAVGMPLLGGYLLVGLVAAWVVGIVARLLVFGTALAPVPALALAGALALNAALARWRAARGDSGRRGTWRGALLLALLGGACALGLARAAAADPHAQADDLTRWADGRAVTLRGTVDAEPDLRAGYRLIEIAASAISLDGGTTWRAATGDAEAAISGPADWFAPAYGDSLEISGKLQALRPGGGLPPEVVAHLASAHATITARGGGNPLLAALAALRLSLAEAIQHGLPEPEAALLIGILLGLKTPMLRARLPLFVATGTIHLVVPAGLKVSLLAALATRAARPLGRWAGSSVALLTVAGYAALGGGGPAAVRAAIMGALLVLAPVLGRRYSVFTALALAVLLMTAQQPALVFDAGFQMTALATLGLPLLVPPFTRALLWVVGPARRLPGARGIAELLAVTLAAQVATLPVLALSFRQLSLIAPLANLLTVPLLAPLLVLGSALAGAMLLGGALGALLALALAAVVWPLLWLVDAVIAVCAALPGASLTIGSAPGALSAVYYATLASALWAVPALWRRAPVARTTGAPTRKRAMASHAMRHAQLGRWALVAVCFVSLTAGVGAALPALAAGATGQLDFLDVGPGGEAILARLPSGATLLIDGGPSGNALELALAPRLPFWQRHIDVALLDDASTGDLVGLEDALQHFTLTRAADMGMVHPNSDYLAWLDALTRGGTPHTRLRGGDSITLDASTTVQALSPPQSLFPPGEGDTQASDDLILRLVTPGLSALFLGSADSYALDALAGSGQPLASDVVELALPPGAAINLRSPLGTVLVAAHPRLIVVCDAPIAPTSKAARVAAASDGAALDDLVTDVTGARVLRTSLAGTVTLQGGAAGWQAVVG